MRIPRQRPLALLLAAALIAAACSDDPEAQDLIDDLTNSEQGDEIDIGTDDPPETDSGDETETEDDDAFEIPAATAPDPDPTPLPVDSDVRIGTLDNGLTYYLRTNDNPGASLDLRLVVDAGSLQQPEGNDGSAHFLEHMMFNGTEAFPGNELTTQLQRLGIEFGADINAYTSYDETVFLLEASTFDPVAVDTAFDVLAEWAAKASIDPAEVAAEVGVVRDELRQGRESVDGIVFTRFEEIYTEGTPYEGHLVIGDAELVEATTTETLRAYYDDWYRPDNMAVIVVGDLPLDQLEREVLTRFSALTARGDGPPPTSPVTIELDPEPVVEVIVLADNGADFLSLDIPIPVWDTGTVGGERMTLIENAVGLMLDNRLSDAFQRGEIDVDQPPFIGTFPVNRGLRYYGTNLQAPELDTGLEQFMAQLLLAAADGFSDDDLARVKEAMIAALADELSTIGSTQDFVYASGLTAHFLEGAAIDDAENRIRRQRDVIENFEVEELTNFWRWILESSGPIVIEVGDNADDMPDAARLREVLDTARPAESAAAAKSIDSLMDRPAEAATTDRRTRTINWGDVEEWTFENGVVVSFLETEITEGSFAIWLESTGGWSALDDPDAAMSRAAVDAVMTSGVGPHDTATLERYLESRDLGLSASIEEVEEAMFGNAATSDAEDLFALIHMTMTDPRVDDVALSSVRRGAATTLEVAETDPDLRQSVAMVELLFGADERQDLFLDQADIDSLTGPDLLTIFSDRFGAPDDLHVAIVGDINAEEAFALAASYLGTLPSGPDESWVDLGIELPTSRLTGEVILSEGTADGGLLRFDWLLTDIDPSLEVTTVLVSTIISNRITETIREDLGASYGGSAGLAASRAGEPGISSFIQINGDPARLDEIQTALDSILAELSTTGPTPDEFERAVQVVDNDYRFVNDALFLSTNLAATRFPDQDALGPDNRFAVLSGISRDDVRDLAAALYADPASVEVSKVLP